MSLRLQKPHEEKFEANKRIIIHRPTVMLHSKGENPIYVQGGECFTQGGVHIPREKIPSWFWPLYAKIKPAMRAKLGLKTK